MKIVTLPVTSLKTNCYLVENGAEAFVIDPGADAKGIYERAQADNVTITAILLTHGHFDHVGGVAELKALTDAPVYITETDALLANSFKNLSFALGGVMKKFTADVFLTEKEYEIAGLTVKTLFAPGHTAGGVCFIIDNQLFSGDTLFELSYGRTDFPTGDFATLKTTILSKLFALDADYVIKPGHGESTTLNFERKNNPILYD